ncbi:Positive regulator of sigma E activity [Sterolibacterium denitrificans]|uniref:Positive regulator of sigma E activity n=1 Tax=Sterolibacterium denitrificans TaxID=157592 RepID=A0A7Z7HR41_9PROT|nr:Positive regulator of sigma E activity [Sterolibacterium denitrificans]
MESGGGVENRGIVTRVEGPYALVEVRPMSGGCGRCHEAGGCGSNLLNETLRPQSMNIYRLTNEIGARVGDVVMISVPEGAVLRVALLAYLLPVLCLIAGAAIGTSVYAEDRFALAGAVIGLMAGLLVLRLLQPRLARGAARIGMRLASTEELQMDCHG